MELPENKTWFSFRAGFWFTGRASTAVGMHAMGGNIGVCSSVLSLPFVFFAQPCVLGMRAAMESSTQEGGMETLRINHIYYLDLRGIVWWTIFAFVRIRRDQ